MKKWGLVAALMSGAVLSSCICATHELVRGTYSFYPNVEKEDAYSFYRVGEQYYLSCVVTYKCDKDALEFASVGIKQQSLYSVPVGVHREPVRKRFYFLLTPDVAQRVLGVTPPAVPEDARYCIPEDDWDAAAAQKVAAPLKKAQCNVSTRSGNIPCQYYADPAQFGVTVPKHRPWDYWVKWPLSAALLVGVDVPCTVVANTLWVAGELVSAPFVLLFQPSVEPTEIKVNQINTASAS